MAKFAGNCRRQIRDNTHLEATRPRRNVYKNNYLDPRFLNGADRARSDDIKANPYRRKYRKNRKSLDLGTTLGTADDHCVPRTTVMIPTVMAVA